jgi:hypothetical protein
MPKIQGKQVADATIEQKNLNLTTPLSGDTLSGATVEYVNNLIETVSGETGIIGTPPDGEYTDGLFTDFTSGTTIGDAVDRFNEVLLLLAPTPPSDNWDNVFSNLTFSETLYTARNLTSGSTASNITTVTTPTYTLSDTVGTEANAKSRNNWTFTLTDTSGVVETTTITTSSESKTSGVIQYTVADPYFGISGKSGFWTGVTAFSVTGDLSTITASSSQRSLSFTHPGTDSPETFNYFVDNPTTPSVGTVSATPPSMTRFVSGVPSLASGDSITGIGFTVTNAVSYFYNNSFYDLTGALIVSDTANPPSTIPTTAGQSVTESNLTATVANGVFSDLSFGFTVTARNITNTTGTNTYSTSAYRVDTVSNESSRLTSGTGNYPSTGWGGTFDSTQSLIGTYTDELQLRNGVYVYPTVNYSAVGGPDYSTANGTRYVTFNLGTFNNNGAFTLTFTNPVGITEIGQANLVVEVKISGATYWVDGDAAYSGTGNPGSTSDGVAAVVTGSSTATSRRITFGAVAVSGAIIVRVGITGTGVSFTGLTATSLV